MLEKIGSDPQTFALRRTLGSIDQLREGIRGFDARAFPAGFGDRLASARGELNVGDRVATLESLKSLRSDLGDYWAT